MCFIFFEVPLGCSATNAKYTFLACITIFRFLDDTQHIFQVDKKSKGVALLDQVYDHLELVEKDYFGLQFSNNGCYNRSSECIVSTSTCF